MLQYINKLKWIGLVNLKKLVPRIIAMSLLAVCISVIMGFSLRSGRESHSQSGRVETLILNFCAKNNITINEKYFKVYAPFVEYPNNITLEEAVRKTAHFTEYFVLGLLCAVCGCFVYRHRYSVAFLCVGAVTALVDERVIQLHLVAGRTSSYKDVLLDCIGFYSAFALFVLIVLIIRGILRLARHPVRSVHRYKKAHND